MTRFSTTGHSGGLPLRASLLAALPIALCMAVMALPELGRAYAGAYRAFYAACFLAWVVPLSLLQRDLWRRGVLARISVPVLLLATYVPSVINNAVAQAASVHWQLTSHFELRRIFAGLDGCWLALIAFCAVHALLQHYDALQLARRREAEAVALAREAELRALQYQMHPHFLFNTLNSISSLVTDGRNDEATRMIACLGDLLRATLKRSDQREVTLAEELSLTGHYLDIEKARFGPRLRVTMRIGAGLLQARVPPLLLQPLAENAIRHGIALRADGGELQIHMEREGDALVIQLRNDGLPEAQGMRAEPSTAMGLANVRQRLETLYPGRHAVALAVDEAGGCTVRLALPLQLAAPNLPAEACVA